MGTTTAISQQKYLAISSQQDILERICTRFNHQPFWVATIQTLTMYSSVIPASKNAEDKAFKNFYLISNDLKQI